MEFVLDSAAVNWATGSLPPSLASGFLMNANPNVILLPGEMQTVFKRRGKSVDIGLGMLAVGIAVTTLVAFYGWNDRRRKSGRKLAALRETHGTA